MFKLGAVGMKGGSWAVAGSVGAHGLALAVGLHFASAGGGQARLAPPSERDQPIEVVTILEEPLPVVVPAKDAVEIKVAPHESAPPAAVAAASPRSAAPGPASQPASAPSHTSGPSGPSGPSGLPVAAPAPAADEAPPQFNLPSVGASGVSAPAPNGAAGAGSGSSGASAAPSVGDGPLPESAVSARARLSRGGPPTYPPAARADGVEGDVVLELVLSTGGAVESARVVRGIGHGLDEAATTAARGYAFTPAQKDGHAVRVRMLWTMRFRIE